MCRSSQHVPSLVAEVDLIKGNRFNQDQVWYGIFTKLHHKITQVTAAMRCDCGSLIFPAGLRY